MARRRTKSNNSLWLTTGILLLIFVAALFYLEHHSLKPKVAAVAKKSAHTQSVAKPKFDFYNVLPQTPTPTQKSQSATTATPNNLNKLAIPTPSTSTAHKASTSYMLRVASLKNFADADRIKAELTLLGYNVNIQKVTIKNITWNRVNLGPYNSLTTAQSAQNDLKKTHYASVILKSKK